MGSLAALLAALAMIGPFAIDTYLPSFPAIQAGLGASTVQMQQTLSVYLVVFAAMMLFHGTVSDSFGRRPVADGAGADRLQPCAARKPARGGSPAVPAVSARAQLLDAGTQPALLSHFDGGRL